MFGCGGLSSAPSTPVTPPPPKSNVTVSYLEKLYAVNNEAYFQNKLPKVITIELSEERDMATTFCNGSGNCIIKFNLRYTAAERVADFTILHEMCHVKVWGKEEDDLGQEVAHGRLWRSCMLQLDQAGAFREIIIDGYREAN